MKFKVMLLFYKGKPRKNPKDYGVIRLEKRMPSYSTILIIRSKPKPPEFFEGFVIADKEIRLCGYEHIKRKNGRGWLTYRQEWSLTPTAEEKEK